LLLLFAPLDDVTSAMYPDSPNALAFRYALLTTNLNISLVLTSMSVKLLNVKLQCALLLLLI